MTKVIVNADDFGLTSGVNAGIIKAYQEGILTSTTAMMNGTAVEEAFQLASENPGLGLGIHFVLTFGKPLSGKVSSLTDENGNFLKSSVIRKTKLDPKDVEEELRLQLKKFMSFGLKPTHLDNHHNTQSHEDVYPIVKQIAKELDVPMRRVAVVTDLNGPVITDALARDFYASGVSEDTILKVLDEHKDTGVLEIMTHPAIVDEKIKEISSYNVDRGRELEVLTSPSLKAKIEKLDIEFIKYSDLGK